MTEATANMIARANEILAQRFRGSPPECVITSYELGLTPHASCFDFLEHFAEPREAPSADWEVQAIFGIDGHSFLFRVKGATYPEEVR